MNKQKITCLLLSIALILIGLMPTIIKQKQNKDDKIYAEQVSKELETQTTTTSTITTTTTKKVSKGVKTTNKKVNKKQDKNVYKEYAKNLVLNTYGWSQEDYDNLVKLWNKESNWNMYATNKSCYGIPQACPGSKMGNGYKTDYTVQIKWGLKYIKNRYGNPTNAWKHSQKKGWY